MDKKTRFSQIEAYINQTLKGDALVEFERTLQEDETLAKEVALLRDLNEAMNDAPLQKKLSKKLEQLGTDYIIKEKTKPSINSNFKKYIFAFFIFIILGVSALLVRNSIQKTKMSTAIYADHYAPYPFDETTRGSNTTDTAYAEAMEHYQKGNYAATLPILQAMTIAEPNDVALKILLGNCFLNVNPPKNQDAITLFQTVAKDDSHLFVETAEWYLALSLLQDEQKEKALAVLKTLASKKVGKYPKLAKQLLKEL